MVTISEAIKELMKTYVQYPPRKLQSEVYTGPITISQYERLQYVRELLRRRASAFRCRPATDVRMPGEAPGVGPGRGARLLSRQRKGGLP